ncbi:peptidase M19 [Alicyclobacillaceae bacterium I2511]|nr:peptidase M19 [Alicyclobacillaceae bacterium I2511]
MDNVQHHPAVFDLHSDIITDIAIRRAQGERSVFKTRHFPRLVKSGVMAAVLALWVEPHYRQNSPTRLWQLLGAFLADLADSPECVRLVTDKASLLETLEKGKFGVFLGVEGMTFVEQWPVAGNHAKTSALDLLPERLRESLGIVQALGLRHAILVWGEQNQLAGGPGGSYNPQASTGLTPFGRYTVQELAVRNIVVDVSHLDESSTDGVFSAVPGVVIASHSNARALCNVPRNLSDAHLREIGRRNGVVGINAYSRFLHSSTATLDHYIDHLVYVANQIGIDHVALGFDFMDYLPSTLGFPEQTQSLERVEDVPNLLHRLRQRGFSTREVEQISFYNALRIFG